MGIINASYNFFEELIALLSTFSKQTIYNYCELESAYDKVTLIAKDGSLVTLLQVDGYSGVLSPSDFKVLARDVANILTPLYQGPGHSCQFFFAYDPELFASEIKEHLQQQKTLAKRIGLDLSDMFEAREQIMTQFCGAEKCFFVIWTLPSVLDKRTVAQGVKLKHKRIVQSKLPKSKYGQKIFNTLPEAINIHQSLIQGLVEDFKFKGVYVSTVSAHEAVYHVRHQLAAQLTSQQWRPFLPGDRLPLKQGKLLYNDISEWVWPSLSEQIFPCDAKIIKYKDCQLAGRTYSSISITLFPKDVMRFDYLFRKLKNAHMPWRISYRISPNGMSVVKSKTMLAKFLAFSNSENQLILDAADLLKNLDNKSDDPIIKLSIILTTWAPLNDPQLLAQRKSRMMTVVQSWGGCEVSDQFGDAFMAVTNGALAMSKDQVTTATAAPLSEVCMMLPLSRPASPWSKGSMLFRSIDGKLWPYQPGSSEQISWVDLIYARSGSGKSVLLNAINLAVCLSSGLDVLPYISIIDVGPSSCGFISLLQEALPNDRKNEAVYHRLKMDHTDVINPFDTILGARRPTHLHRVFLLNFLSLLLVDKPSDSLPQGMMAMLGMIIDELYTYFSDQMSAKPYVAGHDPQIDQALVDHNPQSLDSWWAVVDVLFKSGQTQLAIIAQSYAMPNLSDTITVTHQHGIRDLYSSVISATGEDYISYFCRVIAGVIRNYPSLTATTRLRFTGARVMAMDLNDVAQGGSDAAAQQASIAYMLSRYVLAQNYFMGSTDIANLPVYYKKYHHDCIEKLSGEPKRLVFDEFHRTSGGHAVRQQVLRDMREGRKWNIQMALSSQSLSDFDPLMLEFATSTFIMAAGTQQALEKTADTFGLSESESQVLRNYAHGPSSKGVAFLAQFATKRGLNTQLLNATFSSVELWALTTTSEDVHIRAQLYNVMSPKKARQALAKFFPSGSAVEYIDVMIKSNPELDKKSICEQIIQSIVKKVMNEEHFELLREKQI
ncbi:MULTISPECIES: AAA family ATPase [Cysteiniphilum]|uniref:AAA family ATPase n=1 Tax=Cysteiniphilum TaxID=2056696 RepID=UPI0017846113|nr:MULTISPECIES: AAA family ATPase [Cysteiniphilum]